MPSLTDHARDELAALDAQGRRRVLRAAIWEGPWLWREGRRLVNFAGNDYLGLAQHPAVLAAMREVSSVGAGASRLVAGEHAAYTPLEAALAAHHGQEAALVFSSGYVANLGAISVLAGPGDLILSDKLAHASMLDGARLSGAACKRFAHNDPAHAEALLTKHRPAHRHCLLMTEAVFSMDGDVAPLAELAALAARYDAWLLVDAAHALMPLDMRPDVTVGTLSKALGGVGGYVAAPRPVIDLLIATARPFIFSTGLPPGVAMAACAALRVMQAEPQRAAYAMAHASHFAARLDLTAPAAAIVPVPVGGNEDTLRWSAELEAQGFAVPAIRPPTVPPGTARLRVSFSALHEEGHVEALADAVLALRRAA